MIDTERCARNLLEDGITHVPHPWQPKTHTGVLVSNRLCEMIHDAACAQAKKDSDTWDHEDARLAGS
jgi:hypothetical protein